jgi:hypothetical protein
VGARAAAPPLERKNMGVELTEVSTVRDCIAKVVKAREAHALVVGQRGVLVQELNQSMEERTAMQAQLAAREKEIALGGGEIPDEPLPEEAEITRLNRHVRIRQERAKAGESKARESQAGLDAQIRELEAAWIALGAAISDSLLKEFRSAASALKVAHLAYRSLSRYFTQSWNSAAWGGFDARLTIVDPRSREFILNPIHPGVLHPSQAGSAEEWWPASVLTFMADVDGLRAEVDSVIKPQ